MQHHDDWCMLTLDLQDAFLTVKQTKPTVVFAYVDNRKVGFVLHKCLPGQRDAAANWFSDVDKLLKQKCNLEACVENPVIYRSRNGGLLALIHVDDMMVVGTKTQLLLLVEQMSKDYTINVDWLEENHDVWFLKRCHQLKNGSLYISPHPKHIEKLLEMVSEADSKFSSIRVRKTPMPTGEALSKWMVCTEQLSANIASTYRTCVGILLYIASDFVHAQFAIRFLATKMKDPTAGAFNLLKHLVSYLRGVRTNVMHFEKIKQCGGLICTASISMQSECTTKSCK